MNYKILLIGLLHPIILLNGSDNCFATYIKDAQTGVITTYPIIKVACSCPCTANRAQDGTCQSCSHKVIEKKPF